VSDVIEALRALLDEPGAVGEVFNVGATNEITIHALAKKIVALTDSPSTVELIPYDEAYEKGFEDMERRVPDISKVTASTGWRPSRSLDEILQDVIAFESKRLGRGPELDE
jgi:UDP-glucose 4-epimerase